MQMQPLAAELDSLPIDQKNLLWQMCEYFQQWSGLCYKDSFRRTFELWASDVQSYIVRDDAVLVLFFHLQSKLTDSVPADVNLCAIQCDQHAQEPE